MGIKLVWTMGLRAAVPVFIDEFFVNLNNLKKITKFVRVEWYILVRWISNFHSTKRNADLNKERRNSSLHFVLEFMEA